MNKIIIYLCIVIFSFCLTNNKAYTDTTDSQKIIHDYFIENTLKNTKISEPEVNTSYNYESFERIPIKLKITKDITTLGNNIYENMPISFTVRQNVKYKNKIILYKGTKVKAKISSFIKKGMNGIPGMIIVEDFKVPGIPNNKIKGTYIKRGISLSLIVFPIKLILTPLPPTGSLTNLIFGGSAKITDKDTVIIYYCPGWE